MAATERKYSVCFSGRRNHNLAHVLFFSLDLKHKEKLDAIGFEWDERTVPVAPTSADPPAMSGRMDRIMENNTTKNTLNHNNGLTNMGRMSMMQMPTGMIRQSSMTSALPMVPVGGGAMNMNLMATARAPMNPVGTFGTPMAVTPMSPMATTMAQVSGMGSILSSFLRTQRQMYFQGLLRRDHQEMLADLGISFGPPMGGCNFPMDPMSEKVWNDMYGKLQIYISQNGSFNLVWN